MYSGHKIGVCEFKSAYCVCESVSVSIRCKKCYFFFYFIFFSVKKKPMLIFHIDIVVYVWQNGQI